MRLFWWQHLPLLILIQLLEPFRLTHKLQAEALLAFKSTVGTSLQLAGRIRRYNCVGQRECPYYHKLRELGVVSWFPRIYQLTPQVRKISFSPLHSSLQLEDRFFKTRKVKIATAIGEDNGVPILTPSNTVTEVRKPSKQKIAAIVGGVGAALLVVITGVIVYFCLTRIKRLIRRGSDTASSVPSPPDDEGLPKGKLEMRQRLLIALGAAKGLEHLHNLVPPFLHMNFRTRNVLVDENFAAKVSDFGLSKLVAEDYRAESSSAFDCFRDPELRSSKDFSEGSDVYSFGVFLLELISGREALGMNQSGIQENLLIQAKGSHAPEDFVDKTVRDHTMQAVRQMMELALLCTDTGVRRPTMTAIVEELERIRESELGHLHPGLTEDISVVTLGSELFK